MALANQDVFSVLTTLGFSNVTAEGLRKTVVQPLSTNPSFETYVGYLGKESVALKILRRPIDAGLASAFQNHGQALGKLSGLEHSNVVSIRRVANVEGKVAFLLPWLAGGKLPVYLMSNPQVDRLHICIQIAEGLAYLHHSEVVHGDLRVSNILVSSTGVPALSGFVSTAVAPALMAALPTKSAVLRFRRGTSSATPSTAMDIYALGVVFLKILTEALTLRNTGVTGPLSSAGVSDTNKNLIGLAEDEQKTVGELINRCLSENPEARPKAEDIVNQLNDVMAKRTAPRPTISYVTVADTVLEILVKQGVKDVSASLKVDDGESELLGEGAFGQVLSAVIEPTGLKVAIKCPKLDVMKHTASEVLAWHRLKHPNVHELIGIAMFRGALSIVSPLQSNGHLLEFVKKDPGADRLKLCVDVASGLAYLHKESVIHGDLKPENVLVSERKEAKIADFGVTKPNEKDVQFTSLNVIHQFDQRYGAPELFTFAAKSQASDVYALGLTVFDAMIGKMLYDKFQGPARTAKIKTHDPNEFEQVAGGQRDRLWSMLEECWAKLPDVRPDASEVAARLSRVRQL